MIKPELLELSQELSPDGLMRVNCTFFVGNFQIVMPEYFGKHMPIEFHEQQCITLIKEAAKKL